MYNKSLHKQKEKGQGLVEYALILVLVAIVVIAALMMLSPQIVTLLGSINFDLACRGSGGCVVTYSNSTGCGKNLLLSYNSWDMLEQRGSIIELATNDYPTDDDKIIGCIKSPLP